MGNYWYDNISSNSHNNIFFYENDVKEVPLFKQMDFNTVNSLDSWRLFREELNILKGNAKIENFKLILDKNNNIYSVGFDVIDKYSDKFTVYHYSNCFSCELEERNQINISKSTVDESEQYDKLLYADSFFQNSIY